MGTALETSSRNRQNIQRLVSESSYDIYAYNWTAWSQFSSICCDSCFSRCLRRARFAGKRNRQYVICSKYSITSLRQCSKYGVRKRGIIVSMMYINRSPLSFVHHVRLPKYSWAVKKIEIDFGIRSSSVSVASSSLAAISFEERLSLDNFRFVIDFISSSRCRMWCRMIQGVFKFIGCTWLLLLSSASNWLEMIRTMLWIKRA